MIGRESGQLGRRAGIVGPTEDQIASPAYRIRRGNYVSFLLVPLVTLTGRIPVEVQIVYDDGTDDTITAPWPNTTAGTLTNTFAGPAKMDGWVVGMNVGVFTSTPPRGSVYVIVQIASSNDSGAYYYTTIAKGYHEGQNGIVALGEQRASDDLATWVFQGTVAEDATAGTHVCTLTVTPGAGNEMQVLYGFIIAGNTATAQVATVFVTDGTNQLSNILDTSGTTVNLRHAFPGPGVNSAAAVEGIQAPTNTVVSGTMQLVLRVSTAAVSVTQTFAVVCRIRGGLPTATLADTVGTPTLTVNTSAVF